MGEEYFQKTDVQVEDLTREHLRQTLRYWDMCRAGRAMPSRADIDPLDIPYLLSSLMIVELNGDHPAASVRLTGTRIVDEFGFDPTGRLLQDIEGIDTFSLLCRKTAECAAPTYAAGDMAWARVPHKQFQAVALPLSSDGTLVDKLILSFHFPEWRESETTDVSAHESANNR